jgi:hypothetical protein
VVISFVSLSIVAIETTVVEVPKSMPMNEVLKTSVAGRATWVFLNAGNKLFILISVA